MLLSRRALLLTAALAGAAPLEARAEVQQVRLAKQFGLPHLSLMITERLQLVEKAATAAGLGTLKVESLTVGGASALTDALLSGQADFISAGVPTLATLWDKTVGTPRQVAGLCALQSAPAILVTRNPSVKTIRDYTDTDRIALPAVKLTAQAIMLQMAAAKEWGRENFARLDPLTVSRAHPDATIAMLTGKSEITSHFAVAPFYYSELADPNIRKVLHSYDVLGGRHTNSLLTMSQRFHSENPRVTQAVLAAIEDAHKFIKEKPREAAAIYLDMTQDKRSSVDEIEKMIVDPDVEYTTTPIKVMEFVDFMNLAGTVKRKPASWKELFLPLIHATPGS